MTDKIKAFYNTNVELSDTVKQYKEKLQGFNFDEMWGYYSNTEGDGPKNDRQRDYREALRQIAKESVQDICDNLSNDQYASLRDYSKAVDKAAHHYVESVLTLLDKSSSELDYDWFNPYLAISDIEGAIHANLKVQSDFASHRDDYHFNYRQKEQMIRAIFVDDGIHRLPDNLSSNLDSNYRIRDTFLTMASKGTFEDLASALINKIQGLDGRYPENDLDRNVSTLTAKTLNAIYGRNDISSHIIDAMRESKQIEPKKLWHTKSFQEHVVPVIDDEMVKAGQEYMDKWEPKDSLVFKLKDKLSREEIFNHFIRSEHHSLNKWIGAMAQYAALTGERLTFQQALDMKPQHNFLLSSTKAYSDMTDSNFDGDAYRNIEVHVELAEDIDEKYDGEQMFEITLYCKSMNIDTIEEEMSDQILKVPSLSECAGGFEGIRYEGSTDEPDAEAFANDLAAQLKSKLESLNAKQILPGDVVQVSSTEDYEAEEFDIKEGKKALVTDVNSDGDFKLKGSETFIPNEMGDIKKKHIVKKSLEAELSM